MRAIKPLTAVVALFLSVSIASADALKQVPDSAVAILRVKDLGALDKKVVGLAEMWGLSTFHPALENPLDFALKSSGITEGINKNGEMAVAFIPPARGRVREDSVLIIVPVTDFKKFVGNFNNVGEPDADGIVTARPPQGGPRVLIHPRGNYAAISVGDRVLKLGNLGPKMTPVAKKALANDIVLWANGPEIRKGVMDMFNAGREEALENVEDEVDDRKFAPIAKIALTQLFNVAEAVLRDGEAGVIGLNIVPGANGGIQLSVFAEFSEGSYLGKFAKAIPNTKGSMLAGLPDSRYIAYGGINTDSKVAMKLVNDFAGPILKELGKIKELEAVKPIITASLAEVAATNGVASFGLFSPMGEFGKDPMLQAISIQRGDAKAIRKAQGDQITAGMEFMKKLTPGEEKEVMEAMEPKQEKGAMTVDGVSFDKYTMFNIEDPENPELQMLKSYTSYLFGKDGMQAYSGMINDTTLLGVSGLNEAQMKVAVAAVKGNVEALSKTESLKMVAKNLPAERAVVLYVRLDEGAKTGLKVVGAFMPNVPEVKLADDLPPVGITLGSDETAIRVDAFIPSKSVQAMIAAGMKAFMEMQGDDGGL